MPRDVERAKAAVRVRSLEAEMETFFEQVLREVAEFALEHAQIPTEESITAALNPTDLKVLLSKWQSEMDDKITPQMKKWYSRQMEISADVLPDKAKAFLGPNVRDARAVERVKQIDNRLRGVGDTMYDSATDAMRTALERGEGPLTAARRVREVLGSTSGRATLIARTESAAAVNGADWSVASELHKAGVVTTKEWLSTSDSRTRETHRAADGQIVPQDQPFLVGGSTIQFPADPSGPADETIQCRCSTLLGVDESTIDAAALKHPEMVFEPVEDVAKLQGLNFSGDTQVSDKAAGVLDKWVQLRGSGTLTLEERSVLSEAIDLHGVPAPVLRRGENINSPDFRPGGTVDFKDPVATSTDYGSAVPYAENGDGEPVVFILLGKPKALKVSERAEAIAGFAEEEWITKGRFKIERVKTDSEGILNVYIGKR